ncbi:L-2-hydroxyglutarate oxidase [Candidatus Uabimicrobium sp. HlEnr_7]|uniref:L-2-hydroxyglutarate oxidase n=1 Tax=Candidatus Uabimicrobium helgolandensis TaxID=3095367 RepID=UPI0035581EC8
MNEDCYDVAIVGAGIVGLATAYEISKRFPQKKVVVLEKENSHSLHQTGRNSGVIHSGIYYKPGSMKAKTCVAGVKKLYSFCEKYHISHKRIGKIIVASNKEEQLYVEHLYKRGLENNVPGIEIIDRKKLREIEEHVDSPLGIWVPTTGIVNYKDVCYKLVELIKSANQNIIFNCHVKKIKSHPNYNSLITKNKIFKSRYFFNCAGLNADYIAKLCGLTPSIRLIPFRGEYYKLVAEQSNLVRGLIYPVPNPKFPFLGVHLTKMIDGSVEIGPNAVLSFKREGYSKASFSMKDFADITSYKGFWKFAFRHWRTGVNEYYRSFSKRAFVQSTKRLLPIVTMKDMVFQKIGVRAQALDLDGNLVDDFCVERSRNALHILNAPSPAATASLAIAESIINMSELI